MNIYTDFLSLDEIQFITGRKQPARMIETLNEMGIPFVTNAHGTPIVRRDYAAPKPKRMPIVRRDYAAPKPKRMPEPANDGFVVPNVLKSA